MPVNVIARNMVIRYNSKKSSLLIRRNKSMMHALTTHAFVINGYVIEESVKVKYIGHIICNDLSDDDMMRQRLQLYAQGNVIFRLFQFLYTYVHVPVMVEV